MYYNYDEILSYNAFLNFLIGERGVGKTYGITKHIVKRFIKYKEKFVYIRRYKTEMTKSAPSFFEKIIINKEFEGFDFKYKNNKFYINDELAGYSVVLSTSQQLKSTNFINVKWIIFDEFMIEKSYIHYIPDEVNSFLGLIETISRLENVRCFLLGNSVTINNPYFDYFNLDLPYNSEIKLFKNNLILVQYMSNLEYRNIKSKTRFGQLVKNTNYEAYAIQNVFNNNNNDFIQKKSGSSKFAFTLLYEGICYGVWTDFINNKFYISYDYYKNGFIYSCTMQDHKPSTIFIKMAKKSFSFKLLIEAFQSGLVFYENKKIRDKTLEIFKFLV